MRSREYVWIKYKMSLETKALLDKRFKNWKLFYGETLTLDKEEIF